MGITKADGSQADLGASTSEKAPAGSITSARWKGRGTEPEPIKSVCDFHIMQDESLTG